MRGKFGLGAYKQALESVRKHGALPVPLHIRNASTGLMKGLGYGRGYRDPHDHANAHVVEQYLPEPIRGSRFYRPTDRGFEAEIRKRLAELKQRRTSGNDG